ncbi:MAG: TonB-dependent receptor [Burkholderiales bacterium 68-20]|nr:MAG: TonB-dependent receptor [Burkholderiales bacterium 68-20]
MHRILPRPAPLALAVSLALGSAGLGAQTPAPGAWQDGRPRQIAIAAQPLGDALNAWARQTGAQLAVPQHLVAGKAAPAVSGALRPREALERLLAGSGLHGVFEGPLVSIEPVPAAGRDEAALAPVTVVAPAAQEVGDGPVRGYVAKRSMAGTKTDTPLIETPQSISVVGAEEIENLKVQNLVQALAYVAGVNQLEGTDRTTENLMLRGFQASAGYGSLYRDGSKYMVNPYNGQQEPYGLERLEVLKGAASVLYGTAAPGGIVNAVTKRPTSEPLRELNLEAGRFNHKQVSGDFGGRFAPESDWSYRLTFLGRDSGTFIDYVGDDRIFIAPALKWQPNAQTSFTLLGEYQRDRTQYVYGLPAQGTIQPNANGRISRSLFVGEKSDQTDYNNVNRGSLGYLFEHAFDGDTRLRHSLRYMQGTTRRSFTGVAGLTEDQRSPTWRAASGVAEDYDMATSDTSVQRRWRSGAVQNTTLAGLDYTYQDYRKTQWDRDIAGSFDYFNPTYGRAIGDAYNFRSSRDKSNRVGLYAQNQAKIDNRWVVLAGGRQDWSRGSNLAFFKNDATQERTSAFTGRLGVVYLAGNGLAPYASYSQSFEPTAGADRTGDRFKPTEGEQYEAGVRYQPEGRDVLLTAAVYQLTRTHVSVTDPVDINFSVQQGKVRSRGLELEARARAGRHTHLIAAYAYTDARTLVSSPLTPELAGKRTGGVPYNQLSVWVDHDFGGLGSPGLKAGVGARYVGATQGLYMSGTVPAFTVFDAMASYTAGPWRFALNVSNLADKTYVVSCTYGCFYGDPRRVTGTVTYRW